MTPRGPQPSFAIALFAALTAYAQPSPQKEPGVVTTRQAITPAGVVSTFDGRVYGIAFGESSNDLYVLGRRALTRLDWGRNTVVSTTPLGGRPGLQGVRYDPAARQPLFTALTAKEEAYLSNIASQWSAGSEQVGPPAIAARARVAVMPLTFNNQVAVIDLTRKDKPRIIPTKGIAPFAAAVSADAAVAWVSHFGGRIPRSGDLTAPTGLEQNADRVAVDRRGIAASGTVSRIDLATGQVTHTVETGLQPTGLAWDETRQLLYIANSNADSITVINTRTNQVRQTWPLTPFAQNPHGLAPTALLLHGNTLYVALGGVNAIALLDAESGKSRGLIPTAWYPCDIAISPDGRKLAVAALLGPGSGWRDQPNRKWVLAYRGSAQVFDVPSPAQLASYTRAVADNNHLTLPGTPSARPTPAVTTAVAIPARAGEPSHIQHVVFIIKENRTYDQVLGALGRGNGDPSLVMFGEDVTPNQHKLSRDFVTFDNFYATGGNSADGHQWLTQANETTYCLWPGYEGRSYPFDGTDPIAYSKSGFLWDAALGRQKTVRIYGEYAGRLSEEDHTQRIAYLERLRFGEKFQDAWQVTAPIEAMNRILARNYPPYTLAVPDLVRARIFLNDVEKWTKDGAMPNLTLVQLPSNHTYGARPGASTPKAMVADNDLALGQIVEALTKSPFWPRMAIFVVEDDAQNGVDHVDGHRTVALAISPYSRRGAVDSTFYSHQSILKTIELILGLPTLSLFDLIANDMRAAFTDSANLEPYTALNPKQSIDEKNPPAQALRGPARRAALDSAKMRWEVPDAAPTERVNRILWGMIRGWNIPYPGVRRSVFAPLSIEIDDDDR